MLPISFVSALVFMSQGTIQNFNGRTTAQTVAVQSVDAKGNVTATQSVPGGPVASMLPIEGLGDNGGGFFNANGAHPFQIPNPISSVLYIWLLLMIPFAFPWTFGKMAGSLKQGMVVLTAMAVLFLVGMFIVLGAEGRGNPKLTPSGVTQAATASHPGGNLEGKETRFGVSLSAIDANSITSTSTGTTNSAHDSYTPIGGTVPLFQIMLGEVDPGGTGTGLDPAGFDLSTDPPYAAGRQQKEWIAVARFAGLSPANSWPSSPPYCSSLSLFVDVATELRAANCRYFYYLIAGRP